MIGANRFDESRFTTRELSTLIGLTQGDEFLWRGELVRVTKVQPLEVSCFWDMELEEI